MKRSKEGFMDFERSYSLETSLESTPFLHYSLALAKEIKTENGNNINVPPSQSSDKSSEQKEKVDTLCIPEELKNNNIENSLTVQDTWLEKEEEKSKQDILVKIPSRKRPKVQSDDDDDPDTLPRRDFREPSAFHYFLFPSMLLGSVSFFKKDELKKANSSIHELDTFKFYFLSS